MLYMREEYKPDNWDELRGEIPDVCEIKDSDGFNLAWRSYLQYSSWPPQICWHTSEREERVAGEGLQPSTRLPRLRKVIWLVSVNQKNAIFGHACFLAILPRLLDTTFTASSDWHIFEEIDLLVLIVAETSTGINFPNESDLTRRLWRLYPSVSLDSAFRRLGSGDIYNMQVRWSNVHHTW